VRGGRTADPVIRRCSTSIRMPKAWLAAVCGVSRAGASNDDAAVRALAQIDEVNSSGHADDDTPPYRRKAIVVLSVTFGLGEGSRAPSPPWLDGAAWHHSLKLPRRVAAEPPHESPARRRRSLGVVCFAPAGGRDIDPSSNRHRTPFCRTLRAELASRSRRGNETGMGKGALAARRCRCLRRYGLRASPQPSPPHNSELSVAGVSSATGCGGCYSAVAGGGGQPNSP
jgi:hypothetical protein